MNNDLEKCKVFLTRLIEIWTTPIHEIKDYRPYYAEEDVEVKHGEWKDKYR